jgi:phosphotransferase system  glucose/maltose/N-acetylglucosamine-specific IIC component
LHLLKFKIQILEFLEVLKEDIQISVTLHNMNEKSMGIMGSKSLIDFYLIVYFPKSKAIPFRIIGKALYYFPRTKTGYKINLRVIKNYM